MVMRPRAADLRVVDLLVVEPDCERVVGADQHPRLADRRALELGVPEGGNAAIASRIVLGEVDRSLVVNRLDGLPRCGLSLAVVMLLAQVDGPVGRERGFVRTRKRTDHSPVGDGPVDFRRRRHGQ